MMEAEEGSPEERHKSKKNSLLPPASSITAPSRLAGNYSVSEVSSSSSSSSISSPVVVQGGGGGGDAPERRRTESTPPPPPATTLTAAAATAPMRPRCCSGPRRNCDSIKTSAEKEKGNAGSATSATKMASEGIHSDDPELTPDRLGRPRLRRAARPSGQTASQQVSPAAVVDEPAAAEHASKDDRDDDDNDDLSDTSSSTTDNCFSPDNSITVINGEKGTRDSPLAPGAQRDAAAPQGKDGTQQRSAILSSSSTTPSLPEMTSGAAASVDDGKKVGERSQGSQANRLMATSNTKMSSNINTNNTSTRVISPLSTTSIIARPIIASSSSTTSLRRTDRRGRGLGWGHAAGLGLRGGMADTMSNGTSGWGPPPSGSGPGGAAGGGGGSGWGAAPGAASAGSAWGSPAGDSNNANQEQLNANAAEGNGPKPVQPQQQPTNGAGALQSSGVSAAPSAAGASAGAAGGAPSSWASAASKGLPPSSDPGANANGGQPGAAGSGASAASASNSKQLEQLNAVREALFSQDGWGGANVKQDTSWDVDAAPGAPGGGGSMRAPNGMDAPSAMAKETNMWGGPAPTNGGPPRNDGTDLWKSTLSGQPMITKQAPPNPWDHKPQNPTDYKNWGEEDDGGNHGPSGPSNEFWRPDQNQFGKPHPNEWKSDPRGPPPNSSSNWGDPMSGGRGGLDMMPGGGRGPDGGWGGPRQPQQPPPPLPNQHWGGGGGPQRWGGGMPGGPGDHDSPNMQRRNPGMEDSHGTSLWGQTKPGGMGPQTAAGSQWKEMPQPPNSMNRGVPPGGNGPPGGVPGPGGRMMPMGGSKEPWGSQMPPPNRMGGGGGWGEEPPSQGGGSGWGDVDPMKREATGWGGNSGPSMDGPQWKQQPRGGLGGGPIRQSPNWDDHPQGGGPLDGPVGGWGQGKNEGPMGPGMHNKMGVGGGPVGPAASVSKEAIWSSKQFRILCDMGYRKDDVEAALRSCGCRLDDALEMLAHRGMPQVRQMPPDHPYAAPGDQPDGGPMRPPPPPHGFPQAGGGYPPHDHPGMKNSVSGSGIPSPAALMSAQQGGRGGAGGPGPQPPPNVVPPSPAGAGVGAAGVGTSAQPSAQQLRILVQQIQMAVQAGHLNPAILNQPLAPQTLILLNQLLQQIKTLQQYQQQHNYTRSISGMNPNAMNTMHVKITETKQHIVNLQNKISAQQANYLKNIGGGGGGGGGNMHPPQQQQPPMPNQMQPPPPPQPHPSGDGGVGGGSSTVQEMFQGLNLMGSGAGASENGSRLAKWTTLNKEGGGAAAAAAAAGFPKAPGAAKQGGGGGGPNLLLDDARWSLNSDSNGGWPETTKPGGEGASAADSFGIPEFVPGKQWKGPGLKDPEEDPNLTPGSAASAAALPIGPLSKAGSANNLAPTTVTSSDAVGGLTSPTWSFGQNKNEGGVGGSASGPVTSKASAEWPTSNGPTPTSSTLTQIGQDLWGKSGSGRTPPGLAGNAASGSGWPATTSSGGAGGNPSNGWSSGQNGFEGQGWLLLRNLTPQIDGSTLKTLCIQHGPLQHFDLYLNHSIALVKYKSGEEAVKAQKALHQCLLGNTTIHANAATDNEVSMILQQLGVNPQQSGNSLSSSAAASANTPMTSAAIVTSSSLLPTTSGADTWGMPAASAGSGSIWSMPELGGGGSAGQGGQGGDNQRGTPLNSLLPGDLLGENM